MPLLIELLCKKGWNLYKYSNNKSMFIGYNQKEKKFVPYSTANQGGLVTYYARSTSLDETISLVEKELVQNSLKPCPFCGYTSILIYENTVSKKIKVECPHCSASSGYRDTFEKVLGTWNCRYNPESEKD